MRKLLLSLGFLFVSSYLYADNQWERWRSTEIAGGEGVNVRVATTSIKLDSICVTSGSVVTSTFTYHSATSTVVDVTRTTSSVYNVSTTGDCWYDLDEELPGGFFYSKSGTSVIRIKWNYAEFAPNGLKRVGLKTAQ